MDYHDVFTSCRTGDLEKIKYLVESRDVELNIRDKWDTTPLYYACLCGHEALVKYLLENGAKCEANTFDGERCLYAALNDKIKKLLKNYKMITSSTMRRDLYDEFLRRLKGDKLYCDATFKVLGEKFCVHRCILASRCSTLLDKVEKRLENKKTIIVKDLTVDPNSFKILIDYIYQGRCQVPYDSITTVDLLANQCGLPLLMQQLGKKAKEKKSFESSKPGVHVDVLSIDNDVDRESIKQDLAKLADQALPSETNALLMEMPFCPNIKPVYPDMCVMVQDFKFNCHKAFFCLRSDYFKALLEDHFNENVDDQIECIVLHDISIEAFKCVLYYIYTDSCELVEDTVFEVLYKADMYLLPGLKKYCAAFIADLIDEENVFQIFEMSRLFNLPKLEDQCTEFIARKH
ncbi:ABTB1 [Bugula neritina]|uniref:ABTB1 n=1 Tax=Bugula neritina TaxID=10212 RepID=A0A7J7JC81_BUGNE|nr:ABTB1 [Bugula neritina]